MIWLSASYEAELSATQLRGVTTHHDWTQCTLDSFMEIIKLELEVQKMQLQQKCFQKYTKNMVSVVDQSYPLMYSIRDGRPMPQGTHVP